MTRRYLILTAALTAAVALTSCSLNLDSPPATPAPPTRVVVPYSGSTAAQTPTAAPTATPAVAATTDGDHDLVGADAGAPTNQVVLSNPKFALNTVDLSSPEQVAWAYLTERLSYSYRDAQPGAGIARAARYLTPDAAAQAPPRVTGDPAQDQQWVAAVAARTVASTTISRLTAFHPDAAAAGAEALVIADWNRALSSNAGAPLRTTGTTTLILQSQSDNTWRISDPGMGTAG